MKWIALKGISFCGGIHKAMIKNAHYGLPGWHECKVSSFIFFANVLEQLPEYVPVPCGAILSG